MTRERPQSIRQVSLGNQVVALEVVRVRRWHQVVALYWMVALGGGTGGSGGTVTASAASWRRVSLQPAAGTSLYCPTKLALAEPSMPPQYDPVTFCQETHFGQVNFMNSLKIVQVLGPLYFNQLSPLLDGVPGCRC